MKSTSYFALLIVMLFFFIAGFVFYKNFCSAKEKDKITNDELSVIFNEYSSDLDGCYAEDYANKLCDAYDKSKNDQFISELGKCEINNVRSIIDLLVSQTLNYDEDVRLKKLEHLFNDMKGKKSLNNKEKYAVYEIYAAILYYKECLHKSAK